MAPAGALRELADLHGVQTAYRDVNDRRQEAGDDAILAALRSLGIEVSSPDDAAAAVAAERRSAWERILPPVVAAFGGERVRVELRLPDAARDVACELTHESGEQYTWVEVLDGDPDEWAEVSGQTCARWTLDVRNLPFGYHRLKVDAGGREASCLLIVAPPRAYAPEGDGRTWGVFLPLYALRTSRDWGAGDLTDFRMLAEWARGRGGGIVGTLPILPVYLGGMEEPFDPSPYSPVSRLFWNELVVDLERAPELGRCEPARRLMDSDRFAKTVASLRADDLVDYRGLARMKGEVLAALAGCFFADTGDRRGDLDRFVALRPDARDYALFRAAVARHGPCWWEWPSPLRDGDLSPDDVDTDVFHQHLYAQLLAREQVEELAADLRRAGQNPYLDLPLGARGDGFDVWRFRDLFARDVDTGAPPDTIFTGGQNWGFPPLLPRALREDHYRYLRAVLRHHLALADVLRIDHVMGFHRLYWIPDGCDARSGVYVRYPAEEIYAILTLESHRHRSRLVGENLGTVPEEVEEALRSHGVLRMYVAQYEVSPGRDDVLGEVPPDTLASANTHDMPPFAAFWDATDVDWSLDLGLTDETGAEQDRRRRASIREGLARQLMAAGLLECEAAADPAAVHAALLEWLGGSPAALVLANLEDLWLEPLPQNTPGTTDGKRPNWRRRALHGLDTFAGMAEVDRPLRRLEAARRKDDDG